MAAFKRDSEKERRKDIMREGNLERDKGMRRRHREIEREKMRHTKR